MPHTFRRSDFAETAKILISLVEASANTSSLPIYLISCDNLTMYAYHDCNLDLREHILDQEIQRSVHIVISRTELMTYGFLT